MTFITNIKLDDNFLREAHSAGPYLLIKQNVGSRKDINLVTLLALEYRLANDYLQYWKDIHYDV